MIRLRNNVAAPDEMRSRAPTTTSPEHRTHHGTTHKGSSYYIRMCVVVVVASWMIFGFIRSRHHQLRTNNNDHDSSSSIIEDEYDQGGGGGQHTYDFIIGGMGPSGMGAVYTLETVGKELGLGPLTNYVVLEAKEDMGGKVWQTEFGGYKIETAAGYISGGEDNPFYCEMEKYVEEGNKFRGYDAQEFVRVFGDHGGQIIADDWEYSKSYQQEKKDCDGHGCQPKTAQQRFKRAWSEAEQYGYFCFDEGRYAELTAVDREWCNNLCGINITEIPRDHQGPESILDLVVTDTNLCGNTGKWKPSPTLDMSLTDLMRVDPGPPRKYLDKDFHRYFARDDPDGACPARVMEYLEADKESGEAPWKISGRTKFFDYGVESDFGDWVDYLVTDEKSYAYLLKRVMAHVLKTSVHTTTEIVFDEPHRLFFNSKITKVEWDPRGVKDVVITYCITKRWGQQSYPCVDHQRYVKKAKNFVSTFTVGTLKKAIDCETHNSVSECPVPQFQPPLSSQQELQTSLDHFDMGALTKVYLQFDCKFWEQHETYFTPSNSSGYECDAAPLMYSLDGKNGLEGSRILAIALTGARGKEAARIESSSDMDTREWVCQEFLPVLNHHFKEGLSKSCGRVQLTCDDILHMYIPTWSTDPLSYGCWQITPLGKAAGNVSFPGGVLGNMILSGEGSCQRHAGWVPGGYFSGERSVRLLLQERMHGFRALETQTLCDVEVEDNFKFNKKTCQFAPITNETIMDDDDESESESEDDDEDDDDDDKDKN